MGSNFAIEARPHFEVYGIHRSQPVAISGIRTHVADLSEETQVHGLFDEVQPAFVIHCAAATAIDVLEAVFQM